jgi:hypothetical protein
MSDHGLGVETPTLDKRSKVIDESQSIGAFLDWLRLQGIELVKADGRFKAELSETAYAAGDDPERNEEEVIGEYGDPVDVYFPINEGPSALLHRYFDIDPKAEEAERRALLDAIRARHAG